MLKADCRGGGIEMEFRQVSARAVGGGELESRKDFRGEGSPGCELGGFRSVWWSEDTSVTGPNAERSWASNWATSW